jgi:hypothetical protein
MLLDGCKVSLSVYGIEYSSSRGSKYDVVKTHVLFSHDEAGWCKSSSVALV